MITFLIFLCVSNVLSQDAGHSYYEFSGPLSGNVQQIYVNGINGPTVDYVAKPDYSYAYGLQDPQTGNTHSRQETRNGDALSGEYTVLETDGSIRVVRYRSDPKNGFQATVHYKKN
ncbi:hypothetical protein FQA39_LY03804 [Lamprigera yunnana]|nr:hypothetical protein FQA39_LY03804 [Lamprigera yunnana]